MTFVLLLPFILVAFALIPSRIANRPSCDIRLAVTCLVCLQFVSAIAGLLTLAVGGEVRFGQEFAALDKLVLYDPVSAIMLALVSLVGWSICRFSIRYLDGDPLQGRYFCWTAFTLGSVSCVVLSGNLIVFFIAWVMASLGLHQLLLHYPQRAAAQRAAWAKFFVSRVGDIAMVAAITLCFLEFQTLSFKEIFDSVSQRSSPFGPAPQFAALLIAVVAITKSAQIPFHTWLPLTLETPTPVSALMHAGVVNAGGYLVIRMSPLMAAAPNALLLLVAMGGLTACLGATSMLAQTSIKKKLAYSTIAQMGFMLLQCGLGAFSAALLHICAHSLYKAHAFLSSGTVISRRAEIKGAVSDSRPVSIPHFVIFFLALLFVLGCVSLPLGIHLWLKPGGMLLGSVLAIGIAYWLSLIATLENRRLLLHGCVVASLLCVFYAASFSAVDHLIEGYVGKVVITAPKLMISGLVFTAFFGLLALHLRLMRPQKSPWMQTFYLWACNGFYLENYLRRRLGVLVRS